MRTEVNKGNKALTFQLFFGKDWKLYKLKRDSKLEINKFDKIISIYHSNSDTWLDKPPPGLRAPPATYILLLTEMIPG
jgi:hypothetical protein